MQNILSRRSERIDPDSVRTEEDEVMYLRHLFAYDHAATLMKGGSRVLDLGCGEGYGTIHLSRRGLSVVGLDVEPDAVARARQRVAPTDKVEFGSYDGRRLACGEPRSTP